MKVTAVRTEKEGKRPWQSLPTEKTGSYDPKEPMVVVNDQQKYQEFMGFGGAFTEAAAYTLANAPKALRQEALEAYFSKEKGLGYMLGRVHINSCDFSLENYTYVREGDRELESFDLSREDRWVVPMIKDAMGIANEELKLLASPWSPPGFMKDSGEMNHGGKLLPEFRQPWAKYYVKYIKEMEKRGIPIWAVSVQNEPLATQVWDSCIYTGEEERDFIRDHLGPILEAECPGTPIIIWDHNRDVIVERGATVLMDPKAAKYVWGTGNHWYISEEFRNLTMLHNLFPTKHILFTEGCVELTETAENAKHNGYLGSWSNGERYGRNIIGDFNNWSRGWIDWNLVLNQEGGPNHVGNFCEAPIMYDEKEQRLIYNNSYYYIGHFSKYLEIGGKRLEISISEEGVQGVAFENPGGDVVVVLQNEGNPRNLSLVLRGEGLKIHLPKGSITTYVMEGEGPV